MPNGVTNTIVKLLVLSLWIGLAVVPTNVISKYHFDRLAEYETGLNIAPMIVRLVLKYMLPSLLLATFMILGPYDALVAKCMVGNRPKATDDEEENEASD